MEEDPPPPDDPADARTATQQRGRGDSVSSGSSTSSIISTRTLHSIDLTTVTENSRIYPNASYFMPCDAAEQTRLSILHQVYLSALSGALTTAPITAAATRILDVGAGPGDWAVGIAERFPYADVVGVDLAVWDVEAVELSGQEESDNLDVGREARGVQWEIDDLDIWGTEGETDEFQIEIGALELETSRRDYQEHHIRNTTGESSKQQNASTALSTQSIGGTASQHTNEPSQQASTLSSKGKQKQTSEASPLPPHFDPYTLESSAEPAIGWNFSEPFDFIHLRGLKGAFANWPAVYDEIYKSLSPGGWVEVVDYEFKVYELDNLPAHASSSATAKGKSRKKPTTFPNLRKLYSATYHASQASGKVLGTAHLTTSLLEAAGFTDVRITQVNVPIGTWHEDEKQKAIGKMFLVCLMEGLEATCLRLLTRYGGEVGGPPWSAAQVREACEKAKQELLQVGIMSENGGKKRPPAGEGWCAQFKWVVGRRSRSDR